jgi:hypothetical protein
MDGVSNPRLTPSQPTVARMSNANDRAQVLTLKQTAAYLQISKAHLSNIIAGKVAGVPPLRHVRAGRRILIMRNWADQWLEVVSKEQPHKW